MSEYNAIVGQNSSVKKVGTRNVFDENFNNNTSESEI